MPKFELFTFTAFHIAKYVPLFCGPKINESIRNGNCECIENRRFINPTEVEYKQRRDSHYNPVQSCEEKAGKEALQQEANVKVQRAVIKFTNLMRIRRQRASYPSPRLSPHLFGILNVINF
jgi:hypothetical protein